jgi:hypothetical protein
LSRDVWTAGEVGVGKGLRGMEVTIVRVERRSEPVKRRR